MFNEETKIEHDDIKAIGGNEEIMIEQKLSKTQNVPYGLWPQY